MDNLLQVSIGAISYLTMQRLQQRFFPGPSRPDPVNIAIREISNSLFEQSPQYFNGEAPSPQQIVPLDELTRLTDPKHSPSINLRSTALQMLLDEAGEQGVMEACLEMLRQREDTKQQQKAAIVLGMLVNSDANAAKFVKLNGLDIMMDVMRDSFPKVSMPNPPTPPHPASPVTETMCFAVLYNCANTQLKLLIRAGVVPVCRDILIQAIRDDQDRSKQPRVPIDLGYWAIMMMSELGSVWDPSLAAHLADAKFPKLLLQTSRLTFGNPQTIPGTALRTLAQMLEQLRDSTRQRKIVSELVKDNSLSFIGTLIQGLRSDDVRMVYYCLLLVGNLAEHVGDIACEPNQALASNLVRLLAYVDTEDFAGSSDKILFDSIRKFCKHDAWARLFIKAGIIKRGCVNIRSAHSSSRLNMLQVLSLLFNRHPETHKIFFENDGAKLLIDSAREHLSRLGHQRHMAEFLFVWVTEVLMTLSSHAKDADPLIEAGAVAYSLALLSPIEQSTNESRQAGAAILLNLSSSNSSSTSHRVYQEFERCGVAVAMKPLLLSPVFGERPRALLTRTLACLISRKRACLQFAQRAMPVAQEVCQELTRKLIDKSAIHTLEEAMLTAVEAHSPLMTTEWMQEMIELSWQMSTLAILLERNEWTDLNLGSSADSSNPESTMTHEQAVEAMSRMVLRILLLDSTACTREFVPPKRRDLIELEDMDESASDDVRTWRYILTEHASTLGQALIRRGFVRNQAWLEPILDSMYTKYPDNLYQFKIPVVNALLELEPRPDLFRKLLALPHPYQWLSTTFNLVLARKTDPTWLAMTVCTPGIQPSPNGLVLRNDAWTFESARSEIGVTKGGKYGYDVQVLTCSNVVQVGWCTAQCEFDETGGLGAGDDEESYAIDGLRKQKWHGLSNGHAASQKYGVAWEPMGVLTCLLDLDAGQVSYLYNGQDLGVAFSNLDVSKVWYPALSMSSGQACRVSFGDEAALPDGYQILDRSLLHRPIESHVIQGEPWRLRMMCQPGGPAVIGFVKDFIVHAFAVLPSDKKVYYAIWTEAIEPGGKPDLTEWQWEVLGRLASLTDESKIDSDDLVAELLCDYNGEWFTVEFIGSLLSKMGEMRLNATSQSMPADGVPFWRNFTCVCVE